MKLRREGTRADGSGSTSKSSAGDKAFSEGLSVLNSIMDAAEFEIHHDPFRGLQSQQHSQQMGTEIVTPWHACEWGRIGADAISNPVDTEDAQIAVRYAARCTCPSLIQWTQDRITEEKNKSSSTKKKQSRASKAPDTGSESSETTPPRLRLGLRPKDSNFVCPCDFNPLCLVTLGGAINDVIYEHCQELSKEIVESEAAVRREAEISMGDPPTNQSKVIGIDFDSDNDSTARTDRSNQITKIKHEDIEDDNKMEVDSSQIVKIKQEDIEDEDKMEVDLPEPTIPTSNPAADNAPAKIFSEDMDPIALSDIEFSMKTKARLNGARKSMPINTERIRRHARRILGVPSSNGDTESITVEKYFQILQDWHINLTFQNPLEERSTTKFWLSIPPGISNLGATCYLNTQLQCLAQNVTFLNGIFKWRVPKTDHRMNAVMEKLQSLMARMLAGEDSILTTLDFSNALGIQHDEQQDPNEFGRLLFDRMEESFQQCDESGELSSLFEQIFGGVLKYETVCSMCGSVSERREKFMDINLPIVQRPKSEKKNGTIVEAFASAKSKDVNTDVQFCLDQIIRPESLDGDNQYLCSKCARKCDATRTLKFVELPPVMNVQLSRYVFDRVKFVKKKVDDKVLLPTTLRVGCEGEKDRKYVLCAVMKHLGNSAYSGHYIAEAMDWLNGCWFEFNDELVTCLFDGPSCSFDPEQSMGQRATGSSAPSHSPKGSKDAYNMYYVDETYLSTVAKSTVQLRHEKQFASNQALAELWSQREASYAKLHEMCLNDGRTSDRLFRRRIGIRRFIFPNIEALGTSIKTNTTETDFWVATDVLKPYLGCNVDTALDSAIADGNQNVLKNRSLLCEHNRLSPEKARRGKILSKPQYTALLSLISGERALLQGNCKTEEMEQPVEDCAMPVQKEIFCAVCASTYRDSLLEEFKYLRDARALDKAFDTYKDKEVLYLGEEEEHSSEQDLDAFIASRQTATSFRKKFSAAIKVLSRYRAGGYVTTGEKELSTVLPNEGLEAVVDPKTTFRASNTASSKCDGDATFANIDEVDPFFNSNITCQHGNLGLNCGRRIRYLPFVSWLCVKTLFPRATEYKTRRIVRGEAIDEVEIACQECQTEERDLVALRDSLVEWGGNTKDDIILNEILSIKAENDVEATISNFVSSAGSCRLIHLSNIQRWRRTVRVLSTSSKIKGTSKDEVISFVENLAFPPSEREIPWDENGPQDVLIASMYSLVCTRHQKSSPDLLLQSASTERASNSAYEGFQNSLSVLHEEQYHAYIRSLSSLLVILERQGLTEKHKAVICGIHPSVRSPESTPNTEDTIEKFTTELTNRSYSINPGLCCDGKCKLECPPSESNSGTTMANIVAIEPGACTAINGTDENIGSCGTNVITIDSDREQAPATQSLRVFFARDYATEVEIAESIEKIAGDENETLVEVAETLNFLRRSRRKQKTKYPFGALVEEKSVKVESRHNVAALRLLLYEQCNVPVTGRKLSFYSTDKEKSPTLKCIEPSHIKSMIHEVLVEMGIDSNSDLLSKEQLYLVSEKERTSGADKLSEVVMESLLQESNIYGSTSSSKKKRKRASERGFRGTLLAGTSPSDTKQNENQEVECEADKDDGATFKKPQKGANVDEFVDANIVESTANVTEKEVTVTNCAIPKQQQPEIEILSDNDSIEVQMSPHSREDIDGDSLMQLSQMLVKIVPSPADELRVWDVAKWAMEKNPRETQPENLVDAAFAKYISGETDYSSDTPSVIVVS